MLLPHANLHDRPDQLVYQAAPAAEVAGSEHHARAHPTGDDVRDRASERRRRNARGRLVIPDVRVATPSIGWFRHRGARRCSRIRPPPPPPCLPGRRHRRSTLSRYSWCSRSRADRAPRDPAADASRRQQHAGMRAAHGHLDHGRLIGLADVGVAVAAGGIAGAVGVGAVELPVAVVVGAVGAARFLGRAHGGDVREQATGDGDTAARGEPPLPGLRFAGPEVAVHPEAQVVPDFVGRYPGRAEPFAATVPSGVTFLSDTVRLRGFLRRVVRPPASRPRRRCPLLRSPRRPTRCSSTSSPPGSPRCPRSPAPATASPRRQSR